MDGADASRETWLADPVWGAAFREVEALLDGRLVRAERQARWRPAWFLDLDCGGEARSVYFRGDRGVAPDGVETLRREMRVLQVLDAHGVAVPGVHGFCESVPGIVMERVPGRPNLATAEDDAERRAVLAEYVEMLAAVHALDPAVFEEIGFPRPRTPAQRSLGDLPRWERLYRRAKNQPEPAIELVLDWLRRNVPRHRERVAPLLGDAGQFHFEHGRVTAILDVELAALGDPVADLGALLCRDLSEPLGDLSAALRRYREISGESFTRSDVDYQTVRFAILTPMAVCFLCAAPPPGLNLAQYASWNLVYGRVPLERIAALEGVALDPPDLPDPPPGRHAPVYDALVSVLEAPGGAGEEGYRRDTAARLARWAREIDRRGARLEEQDREEGAALLGLPAPEAADVRELDARLEARVAEAGPRERRALVRFLWRRLCRREALLAPAMRELEGARLQELDAVA